MWIYPHFLLIHPTHPPYLDKNKKKDMMFFGLFSLFRTKCFFEIFHLATHSSHQLLPSITTTNYWNTSLLSPTKVSGAVADAGGVLHQWWLAVVGGSSGCQRWWVDGVGWQWWVWVATVVVGCDNAITDVGIGFCLVWPPPPLKGKKTLVINMV